MNKKQREQIYKKYNGRCAYCGEKIEYKDMQVDHIKPKYLGGKDVTENSMFQVVELAISINKLSMKKSLDKE